MSGPPVTISPNGRGVPVQPVDSNAPVVTLAEQGMPIVLSEHGAPFVVQGMGPPPEPPPEPPGTITDLVVTSTTQTTAQLAFTDAPRAESHQYRLDGGTWAALPGDKEISGLEADTTYSVEVRGLSDVGGGPASGAVEFTTLEEPSNGGNGEDPPPDLIPNNDLSAFELSHNDRVTKDDNSFTSEVGVRGVCFPLEAGKVYEIEVAGESDADYSLNTADRMSAPSGRSQIAGGFGAHEFSTTSNRSVLFLRNGSSGTTTVDYISVREVA